MRARFSHTCSNRSMGVQLPEWWCYPTRCQNGHEWAPGRVIVSWMLCDCPPAVAASGQAAGARHRTVRCLVEGCGSVWYSPRHEPTAS